jgi:hypothetical protein
MCMAAYLKPPHTAKGSVQVGCARSRTDMCRECCTSAHCTCQRDSTSDIPCTGAPTGSCTPHQANAHIPHHNKPTANQRIVTTQHNKETNNVLWLACLWGCCQPKSRGAEEDAPAAQHSNRMLLYTCGVPYAAGLRFMTHCSSPSQQNVSVRRSKCQAQATWQLRLLLYTAAWQGTTAATCPASAGECCRMKVH